MTELLPNIFAIEVQKESYHFRYKKTESETWYRDPKYPGQRIAHYVRKVQIPPGPYEILFTTNECTEVQAASIVGRGKIYKVWYRNYEHKGHKEIAHFKTALPSLQSLLKSKGLTAGNYLIIKKC